MACIGGSDVPVSYEGSCAASIWTCLQKVLLAAICQLVKILTCGMSG